VNNFLSRIAETAFLIKLCRAKSRSLIQLR
jgi:hypothetical protein